MRQQLLVATAALSMIGLSACSERERQIGRAGRPTARSTSAPLPGSRSPGRSTSRCRPARRCRSPPAVPRSGSTRPRSWSKDGKLHDPRQEEELAVRHELGLGRPSQSSPSPYLRSPKRGSPGRASCRSIRCRASGSRARSPARATCGCGRLAVRQLDLTIAGSGDDRRRRRGQERQIWHRRIGRPRRLGAQGHRRRGRDRR